VSADAIETLLAATDLNDLVTAVEALPPDTDTARIGGVVDAWTDSQGLANVLMYPFVIPSSHRVPAVLRGLRSEGYLRLAASVGVGHLPPADLTDDVRRELLDALLDVVATDAKEAGIRASAEVGPLLHADEVELLDDLAAHPVDAVRHNLQQAAGGVTDPASQQPVLLPYLPNYAEFLSAG
jgi:hypothetical protein